MPRKGVKRAFLSYFIIFTTSPFQNPLSETSQTFQELLHARDARAHRNANTFTVPFKTQLKVVSAAVPFTWWLRVDGRPRANAIGGPVNGNLRVLMTQKSTSLPAGACLANFFAKYFAKFPSQFSHHGLAYGVLQLTSTMGCARRLHTDRGSWTAKCHLSRHELQVRVVTMYKHL